MPIAALLAGLLLQAAATPSTGTITVENAPAGTEALAEGIEQALRDTGFIVLPAPSHSRYIAHYSVARHARGLVTADGHEPPSTIGQTGDWGARLRATLPSHKRALHGLIVTDLRLEIVDRTSNTAVWHASGSTAQVEASAADTPAAIAAKLAGPLLRQFPVSSDQPIAVP